MRFLNLGQLSCQSQVRVSPTPLLSFLVVPPLHIIDHVSQWCSREKDLINAAALHQARVVVGNCSAAPAEHSDIAGSLLSQLPHDLGKKIEVTSVVTGY